MTSTESPLEDACGDNDHVFAAEAGAYITAPNFDAYIVQAQQPAFAMNIGCIQPTQVLTNYPMTAGQPLPPGAPACP